jgi:hypothetical protein
MNKPPTFAALPIAAAICVLLLSSPLRAQNKRPVDTAGTVRLHNAYFDIALRGGGVEGLRVDPSGKGRPGRAQFARDLRPENWEATGATRTTTADAGRAAVIGPLRVWRPETVAATGGPMQADKLESGVTLAQTFSVPDSAVFDAASVRLPTWYGKHSGATLRLYRGATLLAERRLVNVTDNDWQEIRPKAVQGAGEYRVTISDPTGGDIGWWLLPGGSLSGGGSALRDGQAVPGARALRVSLRRDVGTGTVRLRLDGPTLTVVTEQTPAPATPSAVPWRWKTTWTRAGYDCTPAAGVVFKRFFSDNLRYLAVEQLKRRANGGLQFNGCRWIEMEGTETADLRLESDAARLHLHWEMGEREMSLRFDAPQETLPAPGDGGPLRSQWRLSVLPRRDSVPEDFPRFAFSDARLTEDASRFWWERAFSYPSPALPAAWFEWMAIIRAWNGGPVRDGEMRQLETCPITPAGYVHTWNQDIGWPLRPKPDTDTRHSDTNARFILANWHHWRWTGDTAFLRRQADRIRRAMRYQLNELRGAEGLIVTDSKDVQGRHRDQGNNYWDILPFGHLDAYANAVFYASLEAMGEMETALGGEPLTDYAALRAKAHRRYDETFWDEKAGRYIGCVDVEGKRHDYGFTFVNLEALYYGLGDAAKVRRVYHWMETEPTSTGKADTYSRFRFAPRATTIHNPRWRPDETASPAAAVGPPSWWVSWWKGTPYGDQCQDGGAILYVSYFDLMVRARYFGADNAWKRWNEILARYRLPDRLAGGAPLFTGEKPQQEDAGQVGTDYPFPESGLVPCYLLYSVIGVEAAPDGLRITPRLPRTLPWAEVQHVVWRGMTLTIRVTPRTVEVSGVGPDGQLRRRSYPVSTPDGSVFLKNGAF